MRASGYLLLLHLRGDVVGRLVTNLYVFIYPNKGEERGCHLKHFNVGIILLSLNFMFQTHISGFLHLDSCMEGILKKTDD